LGVGFDWHDAAKLRPTKGGRWQGTRSVTGGIRSEEYKELAVRERLGLVAPGEKVLFLPANSQAAKDADARLTAKKQAVSTEPVGNLQQWLNFLFGGNRKSTDP
jgi:hypothetical protein